MTLVKMILSGSRAGLDNVEERSSPLLFYCDHQIPHFSLRMELSSVLAQVCVGKNE